MAELIVNVFVLYAALGVIFAIAFVLAGVNRVDPAARGGSLFFRILILPGAAALWPWLAIRWLRGGAVEASS